MIKNKFVKYSLLGSMLHVLVIGYIPYVTRIFVLCLVGELQICEEMFSN